jgi:hypothetical protein
MCEIQKEYFPNSEVVIVSKEEAEQLRQNRRVV